jgi:glycerate kinase
VLVAPDKFKGTFAAAEVAAAMARGARTAGWEPLELPIADGGEGTAAALLAARGGRWLEADVHDALGRPVRARFALLANGATAVVEVAAASGLWRLTAGELDARAASSYGTGELIAAAAAAGAQTVIVAAGGSATTDGGRGAVEALTSAERSPRIVVACDTRVSYERAPSVYGPQKGADPADVAALEAALDAFAAAAPRDPRGLPMSGAAGGLAGGLWAWQGAELTGGAALVLDALGVEAQLARVAMALTGEGRIDGQTLTGKAVGALAERCARAGVPCAAIVGRDDLAREQRATAGLDEVVEATTLAAIAAAAAALLRVA